MPAVTQTVTIDSGRLNWMASFRGRLGFAADRAMFYVTGGTAVADFGGASATATHLSPLLGKRMVAAKLDDHAVFGAELLPQDLKVEIEAHHQ